MVRRDDYRTTLAALDGDWESYLLAQSGLPGPRANLELLQAAADAGSLEQFRRWLGSGAEYLSACGAVGLGRLIAEGQRDLLDELREHANDGRWRVREGVAMGLQRLGARDMPELVETMCRWQSGTLLERRAVVAALCEPPLLRDDPAAAEATLHILDEITAGLAVVSDRRTEDFKALRRALAYGWSVAVAALPDAGKPLLERWLRSADRDIAWLAQENLKKDRLRRMDPAWLARVSDRG
jgi:hypothetical protein